MDKETKLHNLNKSTSYVIAVSNVTRIGKVISLLDFWKKTNSQTFVDHQCKNTHHSGAALVQLNGTLLKFSLLVKFVPSKVNVSVTEVSGEFRVTVDILHDEHLQETNESDQLN